MKAEAVPGVLVVPVPPEVIGPTEALREDGPTLEARVVPVSVPAGGATTALPSAAARSGPLGISRSGRNGRAFAEGAATASRPSQGSG